MTLLEHPGELRTRLVICIAAVGLGAIAGWFLFRPVFDLLTNPFCDFVHHNLSSGVVANAGSRVASAAHSSRGGMLVMRNGGAVTQYQYPVPLKGKRALDETADAFFKDAEACVRWINEMPESPYSREQVRLFTGTALGVTPIEHATGASGTHVRIPRNDPCPCGSGKKYKHCCLQ